MTWIQRPRTVRELFQIGVEMEMPGNIWGIAFPPPDWFAAVDAHATEPSHEFPAASTPPETPVAPWQPPAAPPQPDNVVVIGAPGQAAGGDVALHLARQVAKLVVEAKQQIQAAVREATSKTVTCTGSEASDFHRGIATSGFREQSRPHCRRKLFQTLDVRCR